MFEYHFPRKKRVNTPIATNYHQLAVLFFHCLINEYINTVLCFRSRGTKALYQWESQGIRSAD
jgi:hypothetical protein